MQYQSAQFLYKSITEKLVMKKFYIKSIKTCKVQLYKLVKKIVFKSKAEIRIISFEILSALRFL